MEGKSLPWQVISNCLLGQAYIRKVSKIIYKGLALKISIQDFYVDISTDERHFRNDHVQIDD